jgi:hypothetical protein
LRRNASSTCYVNSKQNDHCFKKAIPHAFHIHSFLKKVDSNTVP